MNKNFLIALFWYLNYQKRVNIDQDMTFLKKVNQFLIARDVNNLRNNPRIEDGRPFATKWLRNLNLELSPSQPDTPYI